MITQKLLHDLFYYNENKLFNKITRNWKSKKDTFSAKLRKDRYFDIKINGKMYLMHRLIYIYHFGNIEDGKYIDHIDGNRMNNDINNLRVVTHQQNCFNTVKTLGYYFEKCTGKYKAQIMLNNKKISLGRYKTENEARIAYLTAKEKHHIIN